MFDKFRKDRRVDVIRQTTRRLMGAQGEANAQSMAAKLIDQFGKLDEAQKLDFFIFLAKEFNPDPIQVKALADAYHADPSAKNLLNLFHGVEPARQELLRRINRAPNGTSAIIEMRRSLLARLKSHPELLAIDADMHHLLSSWFNPGFLELHQITWNSPAQLLEKIIQHESVHAIEGWDDLRRRLQPDRRCYAFFHPQLPGEPLIFVEVALVPGIATDVGVLISKDTEIGLPKTFKTAIFYSISNCQPGLKGVSLGNFLIKRVAQKLVDEIPSVKTFSTLSPIPGFTKWLDQGAPFSGVELTAVQQKNREDALKVVFSTSQKWAERVRQGWRAEQCTAKEKAALMRLCGMYLFHLTLNVQGDVVAKFHLSNGATLHQINWGADLSTKGLQQSAGMMVNYLYELDKVEAHHEAFVNGVLAHSREVAKWV